MYLLKILPCLNKAWLYVYSFQHTKGSLLWFFLKALLHCAIFSATCLTTVCQCETSCWRIAQCNMCCLAFLLLRKVLYEVELSSTFAMDCSNWQHHCTVYHPSSSLSHNFTAVLTRTHAHTSCFSFWRALPDKLLRKLHSVTKQDLNGPLQWLAILEISWTKLV